jgi:uncharacterized membrane protein YhaH (DUF805 family)
MDFGYLYASFEGRIGRKSYWIGVICLTIVMMVVLYGTIFLIGGSITEPDFQTRLVTLILQLLICYPAAAVTVKRLHDRNRPGYFAAFMLVPLVLKSITDLLDITGDPLDQNALDYLLNLIVFGVSIWFFIELGCLRGTIGPNQYGPDPIAGAPAPAR